MALEVRVTAKTFQRGEGKSRHQQAEMGGQGILGVYGRKEARGAGGQD